MQTSFWQISVQYFVRYFKVPKRQKKFSKNSSWK